MNPLCTTDSETDKLKTATDHRKNQREEILVFDKPQMRPSNHHLISAKIFSQPIYKFKILFIISNMNKKADS